MTRHLQTFVVLSLFILPTSLCSEAPKGEIRKPKRFAIIFNMGYAGDHLPKTPKEFERLIIGIKKAHFNVVLCQYTDWRARICKKYDIQILVDLLTPNHHVYKNVEGAKKLCESLKKNKVVYGYHLWSDRIGNTYPGRSRDTKNVHAWDPNHPVYVGTYQMSRVSRVEELDAFGYYDFHWQRGGHWSHLKKAFNNSKAKGIPFLRYCDPSPGKVGKGNPNRVAYTIATSIPFGLKGYTYHYRGGVVDPKTGALDALGKDLQKVNAPFAQIGGALMEAGVPEAVYSTTITRTEKDRPTGQEPMIPGGLSPIPENHDFQVTVGEILIGMFKDSKGRKIAALTSHNAYQDQNLLLKVPSKLKKAMYFDRKTRKWKSLKSKKDELILKLGASVVELIRYE